MTTPDKVSTASIETAVKRVDPDFQSLTAVSPLAADRAATELKQVGYGEPVLVRYRAANQDKRLVFRTMGPNWFGHDRRADRAAMAITAADTYDLLPKHVRVLDVGAIHADGQLSTIRDAGEFYLLTTYVEGELYARDLRRVEEQRVANPADVARVVTLATYLVELHSVPFEGPHELYDRALRDLLGSGEGIFGITDSYPVRGPVSRVRLEAIEERCVAWRWRLKPKAQRLCRTHGDFHPYNVLFREGTDFSVLDASRGSVGDGADDVAAMAINFVFGGVVYPGSWNEGVGVLWEAFWNTYLAAMGPEVLDVIAPFFAWRALVVASPVWYPDVSADARDALLRFAEDTLLKPHFEPAAVRRFMP